jgi:hypothetical protein
MRTHLIPGMGRKARGLLALAALLAITTADSAHAVPVNFANFASSSSTFDLSWTDTEPGSATLTGVNVPVTFEFTQPVVPALVGPVDATMNITVGTTTVGGTSTNIAPGLDFISQPLVPNFTIEFRLDSDNSLLLGVTFTGLLTGFANGTTAAITADETLGQSVVFASDYMSPFISAAGSADLVSLALGLNTPLTLTGNFVDPFQAFVNGGFSAEIVVPEPTSVVLVGLGLVAAPLALRRRRRDGVAAPAG